MYKFGIKALSCLSLYRCTSLIQPISCSAVHQLVHKSKLLIFLAFFRLLSGSNGDQAELISQNLQRSLCTNTPSKEKKKVDYVVQRRNEQKHSPYFAQFKPVIHFITSLCMHNINVSK